MAEVTKLKNRVRGDRTHANRLLKSINDLLQNINLEDEFQVAELKAFKEDYEHAKAWWCYYTSSWGGCSWRKVIEIFAVEGHILYYF